MTMAELATASQMAVRRTGRKRATSVRLHDFPASAISTNATTFLDHPVIREIAGDDLDVVGCTTGIGGGSADNQYASVVDSDHYNTVATADDDGVHVVQHGVTVESTPAGGVDTDTTIVVLAGISEAVMEGDMPTPLPAALQAVNSHDRAHTGSTEDISAVTVQLASDTQTTAMTFISLEQVAGTPARLTGDLSVPQLSPDTLPYPMALEINVSLAEATEVESVQPIEDDGMFRCAHCVYVTDKKANWYKHKNRHSTAQRVYKCEQCSYTATTSSNLRRHGLIHEDVRSFACDICSMKFRQKIHLERHVKYKHEENEVQCAHCDYRCAHYNPDLKVHLWRMHAVCDETGGAIVLQCCDCDFNTVSRRELSQHVKMHRPGPEVKFYCADCCFVTDCESRLRRHRLTHTRVRPFSCTVCDYRASQKEHVRRHLRVRHGMTIDPSERTKRVKKSTQVPYSSATEKRFACTMCTMRFSKLINLHKHLKAQHQMAAPGGEFACIVCDYHGTSRQSLLVHMRRHTTSDDTRPLYTQTHACPLCVYTGAHQAALQEHMRSEHQLVEREGALRCLVDVELQDESTEKTSPHTELMITQAVNDVDDSQTLNDGEASEMMANNVNNLSSGDVIEINGEMYRVAFATAS